MSIWSWIFALLLMVGVPLQVRRSMAAMSGLPRSSIYLNSSITLWILAALAWGVVRLDGDRLADLIVRSVPAPGLGGLVAWTLALTLAGLALFAVSLVAEGMRGWPGETASLEHLRPRTRSERLLALLILSPSAGLCEEFLYRGFLMDRLTSLTGHAPIAALISSAAFGLSHLYQGWAGGLRAGLIGLVLAWPVVALGTLFPSMAAHALIDILAFLWVWPILDRLAPNRGHRAPEGP